MKKAKSKTISYSLPFCTLFVSVDDKLVSILPYHCKHQCLRDFCVAKYLSLSEEIDRMAAKTAMRMVTGNRQGQRRSSYLTFYRSRKLWAEIFFPAGKLLGVDGSETA